MTRIAVLALSEASPVLVDRFCAAGVMPNLAALRERGLSGRTRYSVPYLLTPQLWATILTGRHAASHGIFDYWSRAADGRFHEARGGDVRGPRLWDLLERHGTASGWINVPMTSPPPRTPGFALSGQDAAGAHVSIAHPRALYGDITRRIGRYHHKDIFPGGQDKYSYGDLLPRETEWQRRLLDLLARREDWRFLLAYNSGTAFAQHYFWDDMDTPGSAAEKVVEQTFAAADTLIGTLAAALGPEDTLFVVSECGAGPIGTGVRLNNWLEQAGYLSREKDAAAPSLSARGLAGIRTRAQRHLPRSLFHFANSLPIKNWLQSRIAEDRIDWSRTRAYHRGKGEGNIYVNLRDRERHGIVAPEGYETVRDELIAALSGLKDPRTGAPAVVAVHRREALFGDEGVAAAPDLIVEWRDARYMPSETLTADREIFGERVREYMTWPTSGSHRPEGLFVAHGPTIRRGKLDAPIELVDLAPTWLYGLGCPAPAEMSGRPRTDVFAGLAH